jgi:hypothetical protein
LPIVIAIPSRPEEGLDIELSKARSTVTRFRHQASLDRSPHKGDESRATLAQRLWARRSYSRSSARFGSCDNQHRHHEGEGPICRQERPERLL